MDICTIKLYQMIAALSTYVVSGAFQPQHRTQHCSETNVHCTLSEIAWSVLCISMGTISDRKGYHAPHGSSVGLCFGTGPCTFEYSGPGTRTYRTLTAGTVEAPDAVSHMVLFTVICRCMCARQLRVHLSMYSVPSNLTPQQQVCNN